MSFRRVFEKLDWTRIKTDIYGKTESDVKKALYKSGKRGLDDLMALLSPAASGFLEEMAALSHQITKRRFGNTIQLYIPLYLSNKCRNSCLYCGFRRENKIKRLILDETQILREIKSIKSQGFDHILLVTGESDQDAGIEYFEKTLKLIRPYFSHISMETQPLKLDEYQRLIGLGLNTVFVYQETYAETYAEFHPRGSKSDFLYRLETPDRLGEAEIYKIGLGCLLGLEDWRADSWFIGAHLEYLERKYWKTKYSISFPRLRPALGTISPKMPINDREMAQIICAHRIFNQDVELSLSTRESPEFRDNMARLGVTAMSAGSKTEPGGYSIKANELKQFSVNDDRSPREVAEKLRRQGYEAVWKDWGAYYGRAL